MSAEKTIVVKGQQYCIHDRGPVKVAVSIMPGMLLARDAADTLIPHGAAAANVGSRMFAIEDDLQGKDIDDAYAALQECTYVTAVRGALINALVAPSAAAVVIGSFVESAGDGTVKIVAADVATDTAQRNAIVGFAREAVDNSANAVTRARVLIEIV